MGNYRDVPKSLSSVTNSSSGNDTELEPPEKLFANFQDDESVVLKNPEELVSDEFVTLEELSMANLATPEQLFGRDTNQMKLTSPEQLFNKKQKGNLAKKLAEKSNKKPLK